MNALGFDPSRLSSLQIPQLGASPDGVAPRQASPVVPQSRSSLYVSPVSGDPFHMALSRQANKPGGILDIGGSSCGC